MRRKLFLLILLVSTNFLFSQTKAKDLIIKAQEFESISKTIEYLQEQIKINNDVTEKRALYIFLASIQEQSAFFDEARDNYAKAASFSCGDADGMPKKTNEQLVLDAVRCSLNSGDYSTAEKYLNSSVRNSKNETIQSYIKLYSVWCLLCKAEKKSDLQEPIELLKAYSKIDSMQTVKPTILLTLWYITGEKIYAENLKSSYPKAIETSIVNGEVQMLPTPFWFFVPKMGQAEVDSAIKSVESNVELKKEESTKKALNTKSKLQLGLFSTKENAELLVKELKSKKFDCYISEEKRASGNIYYSVLYDVDSSSENSVADSLRNLGYECYFVD